MKKVGVLTFQRSLNYGASLQAYALVNQIKKNGFEADLIDYRNKKLEMVDSWKRFLPSKNFVRWGYNLVESPMWYSRKKKFDSFLEYSGVSKKTDQIDDKFADSYDKLIVGSDQVWNPKITNFDKNYLFSNVSDNMKKRSYAASFGVSEIPEEIKMEYTKLLNQFNYITVREPEGSKIVQELTRKSPDVVLDPTLLLEKDEWIKVIDKHVYNNLPKKYIVIYQRAYSKELVNFAQELSKNLGIELVTVNGNPRQPLRAKYVLDAGPKDWLYIMNNAEYIVTNSFHGLIFSINLQKKFYFDLLDSKFGVNSRLENIIREFKVENNLISNNKAANGKLGFSREAQKILQSRREESNLLLERILLNE
ncbi:polysaccharide pyruvyl transferase family protein [Enterococcus dongliensis]|uniref:polysaccharide pyruvyl transferase family protein n=1 Tax=Enterococcus dongliensis TaxID=2559925 RepID=UPI00288C8107|nr:polysaccharide pyruvyl transferase family protein [Enterococcus dongliensis]MDT2674685.1 polysaccharide pyruvyl transferase family protein [Enterococcus dongliensis]